MKYINQRGSPRIDIRLRCRISSAGICSRVLMYTENLSRSGMLVLWDAPILPRPGQFVTVEVELPVHHGFGRKCILCQAEVVRATRGAGGEARVALSVNYMKFRAYQEKVAAMQLESAEAGVWVS